MHTSKSTKKPTHIPGNKVQPTGPGRAAKATKGLTKCITLYTTYINKGAVIRKVHLKVIHCMRVIKIILTRTLELEKQRTASHTVETPNTGIIPCHQTNVKQKVGTVCLSPGQLPHVLIPVRTIQIRVRQQTVLVT